MSGEEPVPEEPEPDRVHEPGVIVGAEGGPGNDADESAGQQDPFEPPEPESPPGKQDAVGAEVPEPYPELEDADPEEASLPEEERDDGERQAFDARVDGLSKWGFRDSTQYGDRARLYQAQFMAFLDGSTARSPARSPTGPLRPEWIRDLRLTHVESASYKKLLFRLRSYPGQSLVGRPDTGCIVTALLAVADLVAPDDDADLTGKVHVLEAKEGLGAVDLSSIPAHCGIVLVLPPGAAAPGAAELGTIAGTLNQGSVLVVVADTPPSRHFAIDVENTLTYEEPPREHVLARHLTVRLGERAAADLTANPVVRAELGSCQSSGEAVTLAKDLLGGLRQGRSPEEIIRNRDLKELFDRAKRELEQDQRTYLIVSAVLDGVVVNTVVRQCDILAKLQSLDDVGQSGSIRRWSQCVEVRVAGPGAGNTVHLVHPRLASKILELVWQEQVGLREALLTWLRDHAIHQDAQVRVKAAQVVAKLATYDFDVIRREVLRVWAGDGGYHARQAVAWALEAIALADDGRFAKRVRSLVKDWVHSRDVSLQAAGVAAYGTFLGAEYPDAALTAMRRLAGGRVERLDGRRGGVDRAERVLANIVQKAILDMFLAGAHEKVVAELSEWTRLPLWRWRRCAAACLVRLSRQNGSLPGWPLLMELAGAQPRFGADVAQLWRNGLNTEHNAFDAWKALRRLITLAESAETQWPSADGMPLDVRPWPDGWSREALRFHALVRRLLTDIAAGNTPADAERLRRLRFHIRYWEFRDGRRLTVVPDFLRDERC